MKMDEEEGEKGQRKVSTSNGETWRLKMSVILFMSPEEEQAWVDQVLPRNG